MASVRIDRAGISAVFVDPNGGCAEIGFDDKKPIPEALTGRVADTEYGATVVCP